MSSSEVTVRPLYEVWIFMNSVRPKIDHIPSPKCQTILYKSALEHLWGIEHFASFPLISETFRNSSFGANFCMNFLIDRRAVSLVNNIITAQKCLSLQFIHSLDIGADECESEMSDFASQLTSSKYFRLQLQTLRLDRVGTSILFCFFGDSSCEKKNVWPHLQSLTFKRSPLCDSDLECVAETCPALTFFSIKGGGGSLSDVGFQKIAEKLTSLTSLDLSSSKGVTDRCLDHIAANLTELTTLRLTWCSTITDVGLRRVAENLSSLTFLDLQGSNNITDMGLEHVSKCLSSSLTSLDISDVNAITDVGLQSVTENLVSLTVLNLLSCDNITSDAAKKCRVALPNCTIIG